MAIDTGSELGDLSFIHVRRYWALTHPEAAAGDRPGLEQLEALAGSNDPEDIVQWSKFLRERIIKNQFHIDSAKAQSAGFVYGTIRIKKSTIQRLLRKYADLLRDMVLPIYENLNALSEDINAYFIENKPSRAFKASERVTILKGYTDTLTGEKKNV